MLARDSSSIAELHVDETLFNTCMLGRLGDVERLIAAGGNVNFSAPEPEGAPGHGPIHMAVQEGHHRVVEALVRHGASVNQLGHGGATPLTLSAGTDNIKVTAALLKLGAPVDCVTTDGKSALLIAAHLGHISAVSLLLQHGAEVNLQCSEGYTPLRVAARSGHIAIVRLLLQARADPLLRSARELAINEAVDGNHPEVVALLLENGSHVESPDFFGMSLLGKAAARGMTAVVRVLLAAGADPARPGPLHMRPLDAAIQACNQEILTMLLEHGAREHVNAPQRLSNSSGVPPLRIAIGNGDSEIVRILLEAGANPHRGDGVSPLDFALTFGFPDIVKLLLDAGVDPIGKNVEGNSPLDLANRIEGDSKAEILSLLEARIAEYEREREEKQDAPAPHL